MRVISGAFKGLSLFGPLSNAVRPTTDRVKESMFSLMGITMTDGVVLDLFAGTGSLGLEALSRGARRAIFVDSSEQSLTVVRKNIARCRAERDSDVWRCDWRQAIRQFATRFGRVVWIFLDPPYNQNLWVPAMTAISEAGIEVLEGIVCEHPSEVILPDQIGTFVAYKRKVYGDIGLTLYHVQSSDEPKVV